MRYFGAAVFGCSGPQLTTQERAFFRDFNPFGFILFARNVFDKDQLTDLCASLREAVGRDAPILIDQEGGRVQRLRFPLASDWLPPLDHADALGDSAERGFFLRYRIIADELSAIGIDANCAPNLDVAQSDTHEFLMNRCYGFDPARVSRLGRAAAKGLLAGGVLPVVKHIPGHGRATLDSHHALPMTGASASELETDFAPFRALSDMPLAMTAHVVFSQLDANPATTSKPIIDMIRNDIGFSGLLMGDDVSMQALSGSIDDRAAASLEAGCDVVLHCNGDIGEMRSVAEVAGEMGIQAQTRAERALERRRPPQQVDIAALKAELEALTGR